jgi:hypothetical protein
MARYIVRFMKHVLGENGNEAEICQRSMEIDATDKLNAADLAKVRFCESECVKEWSLHADRVHISGVLPNSLSPIKCHWRGGDHGSMPARQRDSLINIAHS